MTKSEDCKYDKPYPPKHRINKRAFCKYCHKDLGKVPADATNIVCFACNEARDGKG